MSWECPSCGLENTDDSVLRCLCGNGLIDEKNQELYETEDDLKMSANDEPNKIGVFFFLLAFISLIVAPIVFGFLMTNSWPVWVNNIIWYITLASLFIVPTSAVIIIQSTSLKKTKKNKI